jgi:CheY-like chemotaxis protein
MENLSAEPIRVLIADDEESVLAAYRETLHVPRSQAASGLADMRAKLFGSRPAASAAAPGFEGVFCRGAEEAVTAVKAASEEKRPFGVAFLDVRMPPGPDGVWAASRIRELDERVDIVIVTAYSDVDPNELSGRVPPPEKLFYLQKPFHPHEIRQLALALGRKWQAEERIRQLAYFDGLTGLPNRELFILETSVGRVQTAWESGRLWVSRHWRGSPDG